MNADSSFVIGASHQVCQDYAVSRNASGTSPYAILADGCSTSPDTDIGSRLLVKAVEQMLSSNTDLEPAALHQNAAGHALSWARLLDLRAQSVDATLLTAYMSGDEVLVSCSGDGVVVAESNQGCLDVYAVSYPSGYPFYPTYLHQPERLEALLSTDRAIRELKHYRSPSITEMLQLASATSCDSPTQVLKFKTSDYKYIAILSDGIHSFLSTHETITGKRVQPLLMPEVIKELLSFKSLHGSFVARRVKRFLKDCHVRGWQHTDDLSLAVVHLGDPQCSPNTSFQV
jgi:hypothetical protein